LSGKGNPRGNGPEPDNPTRSLKTVKFVQSIAIKKGIRKTNQAFELSCQCRAIVNEIKNTTQLVVIIPRKAMPIRGCRKKTASAINATHNANDLRVNWFWLGLIATSLLRDFAKLNVKLRFDVVLFYLGWTQINTDIRTRFLSVFICVHPWFFLFSLALQQNNR